MQALHRYESGSGANPRLAAAVQALQTLHDEFDIANSAGGEFHVPECGVIAGLRIAAQLARNFFARANDRAKRDEIKFRAIDKRLHFADKFISGDDVARGTARLDEHLQFPLARRSAIVGKRGFNAGGENPFAALWAKAQVDTEESAVAGHLGEKFRNALRETHKEFGICCGAEAAAGGGAIAAVNKHQVDVGTVVKFLAAKFSEGENREPRIYELAFGIGGLRQSVIVFEFLFADAQRGIEQNVGKLRKFEGGVGQRGDAENIAQSDAQIFAALEAREDQRGRKIKRSGGEAREFFVQIFGPLHAINGGGADAGGAVEPENQFWLMKKHVAEIAAVTEDCEQMKQRARILAEKLKDGFDVARRAVGRFGAEISLEIIERAIGIGKLREKRGKF